jgi:hypothetical protein
VKISIIDDDKKLFSEPKIAKNLLMQFFRARQDESIALLKFQNFEFFLFIQSFFLKLLLPCRICSRQATGMFDTSNSCKFSLVSEEKNSPEVDFRFFFQAGKYSKIPLFTTQIDKNIFKALFFTKNFNIEI